MTALQTLLAVEHQIIEHVADHGTGGTAGKTAGERPDQGPRQTAHRRAESCRQGTHDHAGAGAGQRGGKTTGGTGRRAQSAADLAALVMPEGSGRATFGANGEHTVSILGDEGKSRTRSHTERLRHDGGMYLKFA